jgi:hypothetical protein
MAGYSGTPLPRKLGIKQGDRIALLGAPQGFADGLELPERVTARAALGKTPLDLVLLFVRTRAELAAAWNKATAGLTPAGALWVAWPKKSARAIIPSDMTEDFVREVALPSGWVDNKVCAIDDVWSGLRCVLRVENRPQVAKSATAAKSKRG